MRSVCDSGRVERGTGAADPSTVHRQELAEGERLEVYRLVHVSDPSNPALLEDVTSNAAKGRLPRGREIRQPAIHEGLSVFKSAHGARNRRRQVAERLERLGRNEPLRIGDYVARLELEGPDVGYEDRDEPNGHMTIWGSPSRLAGAVAEIFPVDPDR